MKVEIKTGHYYFKVIIDNLCHVCIEREEFIGIHSYYDCDTMCVIEYITKTNKIKTEFDNIEKWKQVLKALNDNL
jgi:hypothetical protein